MVRRSGGAAPRRGEPLRVCQTTQLRPEMRERYLELHAAVWDTVERGLLAANIENYTIFIRGNTLVGYYEYFGHDLDHDLALLDADPETQRWLALTGPCQQPPDQDEARGPWCDLTEVWHLDAF
jgi:L-rhamnose mutarotase